MSLNSLTASNHTPFFPPGIASHKTMSSVKRPINVKECKKSAKGHFHKLGGSANRRLSKSTPDLKVYLSSGNQISPIPKHRCDMGLLYHSMFKATPLPHYYSPDSLERNRTLFEHSNYRYNTRSLDRLVAKSYSPYQSAMKAKSKSVTKFTPDRPFYPPSKYPNIHDKSNVNLHRLLETRQQYKTPKSRRSLSIQSRNKSNRSRPNNLSMKSSKIGGSVPNLNLKKCKKLQNDEVDYSKLLLENTRGSKDQMNFSPEIGLYRQCDKLDLQDEFDPYIPNQMSSSYFYPKPIPNSIDLDYHDKMAQSLYNESSLAAKIQTGSLERATRNNSYSPNPTNPVEVTDLDDSPTKSYSPVKQCNSFSQDSLDGNKRTHAIKPIANCEKPESEATNSIVECDKSCNTNSEDVSLVTESKTYRFQSSTEEDFSTKSESQTKFPKSLSTISERDRTIEEPKKNELLDHENFYKNMLASSMLYNDNHDLENKLKYGDTNNEDDEGYNDGRATGNAVNNSNTKLPNKYPVVPPKTYRYHHSYDNGPSSKQTENQNNIFDSFKTNTESEKLPEDPHMNGLLDQYNIDRYIRSSPTVSMGNLQSCFMNNNPVSIHNEFLDEINHPVTRMNNADSVFIDGDSHRYDNTRNWKTEECFCIDKPYTGESLVKIPLPALSHQMPPLEIDSTMSTIYNSVDTQISGLDYDLTQKGVNQNLLNFPDMRYGQVPRIALNSNVVRIYWGFICFFTLAGF